MRLIGQDPKVIAGIPGKKVKNGLVLGKFMPPTNGHLYMINFARMSCEKLTILVCSLPDEPIAGSLRFKWLKEIFPDANVVHHDAPMPQEPDGPNDIPFYNTWRDSIRRHCPAENFDAFFASEPYGYRVADSLGIKFIPVDVRRKTVPISGTRMRQDPLLNWDHLHPVVRAHFVKRVAIVGPKHSGKSKLTAELAQYFKTVSVASYMQNMLQDYAENIPDFTTDKLSLDDVSTIARGQIASEDAIAPQANKVMFCDTELETVVRWSQQKFNACPEWVKTAAQERKYDLYLLTEACDWWKSTLEREGRTHHIVDSLDRAISTVYAAIPALKA